MVRGARSTAELGERRGSYPIAGATGAVLQMFRRMIVAFLLVFLGFLIFKRPHGGLSKGLIAIAVIAGLIALRFVWSRLSLRAGVRVCHIHTGGLAVTGLFGQVKHVVPWDGIAELRHISNLSPLLTFHRFELVRRGARTVPILVLQANPEFVPALQRASEQGGLRPER